MTSETTTTETATDKVSYGDTSVLRMSGAQNVVYLIPASENPHGDLPHVFVWSNVGAGTPERAWHRRWISLGTVPESAVPDEIESVLRAHEDEILALADKYQGTKWDGSNMIGQWDLTWDDECEPTRLEDALREVPQYWSASDWYQPVTLHEVVTDDRDLDTLVSEEADAARENDAYLSEDSIRTWIMDQAQDWIDRHDDPDADDERDAALRVRLEKLIGESNA